MSDVHANYLKDLGAHLKEQALRARDDARAATSNDHALGEAFAYYKMISLLLDQAVAFGLSARDIGLDGFDPERELLVSSRANVGRDA